MNLHNANADIYVPDGTDPDKALSRTTHMSICAHQDDIEILAYHGIVACFGRPDKWFTGVVVTNGAGSPRSGIYGDYTDEEMQKVRIVEQRKAAFIGEYSCQLQLGYPSSTMKSSAAAGDARADLVSILEACRPEIVYMHNLADKHDTHIGVALRALEAMRSLPAEARPKKVYGCEVWRALDWLGDEEKVVLPVSQRPNLSASLVGVFDSQISGGKRYDLATVGRRVANATYFASHATDTETEVTFAMDLTPLVQDPSLDPIRYTTRFIDQFKADVESRIGKCL
jgi:LmbE family N-acetylglucosaminyl deacetylase